MCRGTREVPKDRNAAQSYDTRIWGVVEFKPCPACSTKIGGKRNED